jgi:large repetitive protein
MAGSTGDRGGAAHRHTPDATARQRVGVTCGLAALALCLIVARAADAVTATPTPTSTDTVTLQVVNALSGQPLVGLSVVVKQRAGSVYSIFTTGKTDASGRATFKLTGVSVGVHFAFYATPYNGGSVLSDDVTAPGTFKWVLGKMPVSVVAGGTNAPLTALKVNLKEKLADGTYQGISSGTTDSKGLIVFDPPGLGTGRVFVLEAPSPWDGTTKRSNEIRDVAGYTFVVGNAPLNVTLIDALSNAPLAAMALDAYERAADGTLLNRRTRTTSASGRATFDLEGLGSGRVYVLRLTAFGSTTDSEDLRAAGEYLFKVGSLSVRVVAGGSATPLQATRIDAYEKVAGGALPWVKMGTTDATGTVRFDLPGLGQGRTYVLRAKSPADGSDKYSNDITTTGSMVFTVGNAPLRVTAVDALSNAPMPNLQITAYERLASGSTTSAAVRTTDATGKASFDLPGLGSGRTYFLASWPFGTGRADSDDLKAAGDYTYKLGTLGVTVINGATGVPLASTKVNASEKKTDGTLVLATSGTTDTKGVIRFDLPGLGKGRTYVLDVKSPSDGTTKRSDDIKATGRFTFSVGRAPLRVRVINASSGDPLTSLKVTANRRLAPDQLQWVADRTTDSTGTAVFDLDDIGTSTYVISTMPYNGGVVYSDDLHQAGNYDLKVGSVELTVLNPSDGTALTSWKVSALVKNADGTFTFVKQGTSDGQGLIRFDLPGLGSGKVYAFEAKSAGDGSTKRSQEISGLGKYVFKVGNAPLVVTVRNGVSNAPLANLPVTASERLASGDLSWVAQRTTDANGVASFDLDGLGSGRKYVLSVQAYNAVTAYSDDLTAPGPYTFRVGTLEVHAVNGATGAALPNYRVVANAILADGTLQYAVGGNTDAAGIIRFDLPGLRAGTQRYSLEAKSPVDGTTKRSVPLSAEGVLTFTIGNAPLRVTLINGVTGAPLPQVTITPRELVPTGDGAFGKAVATDANGKVIFDLDGLGSGRRYVLYAKPYPTGTVGSDPISATGDVYFRVGTVPVTIIDADNNVPLTGQTLTAYEKLPDGTRLSAAAGATDASGTVQFDLPGVSQTISTQQPPPVLVSGRVYAVRASNPFANGKEYWSQIIVREGPVVMRLQRAVAQPLDVTVPAVSLLSPNDGATVDAGGFSLFGTASDNVGIDHVSVGVVDPVRGASSVTASYDAAHQQWTASIGAAMVSSGQTAVVTVSAYDAVLNRSTVTASLRVVADTQPPQVSVSAPQNGATVPRSGFMVAGTAADDVGVVSLTATVDDPLLGRTVTQTLGLAADGHWSFAVPSGQVSQGQTATVTVVARDARNKSGSAAVRLQVGAADVLAQHVINRITFGGNPDLLAQVQSMGVDAFIDQQLNPQSIDDSALNAMLTTAPASKADLQNQTLLRMIYSRRQLLEVLTAFWDNHFNTDINKTQVVAYEANENALFRQRALGRFRDLLGASATSPAMLVYLDQAASLVGQPNENYARELMELHTLSVDGGYTQTDVEQVARAFTGWTVRNGQFYFDATNHDSGQKTVLGQTLPAGRGVEDGNQVLDILAAHPSTARFICTELSQLLVSDTPPASLITACVTQYQTTDGQIGAVVRTILHSPEFGAPSVFRGKVRTPVEMAVFWARALGATSDATGLVAPIADMGMKLFENPVPTGWSEIGDDWINSNLLLQRIRHVNRLVRNQIPGTAVDLRGYFTRSGQTTADGVAGFLLEQLFQSDFTPLDYATAMGVLTDGGTQPFSLNQADADARLQRLVATVLSFPSGQYQ